MTASETHSRAALRQFLVDRFNQTELNGLAFDLGVDVELLPRDTKGEFVRALIQHVDNRRQLASLAQAVLRLRPDEETQALYTRLVTEGVQEQPAKPTAQAQAHAPARKWRVMVAVLAVVLVVAAFWAAWKGPTQLMSSVASPTTGSAYLGLAPKGLRKKDVASDLPGTELPINTVLASGIGNSVKPRDVWRVSLQGQTDYMLHVTADVQAGLQISVYGPSATSVGNPSDAVIRVCTDGTECSAKFTAPVAGDYYVEVVAEKTLVNYALSVNRN